MRAIVLSGGASHGAYQVGVLKHLILDLGNQYDILCGVSVGALSSSFLSMYSKDNEKDALLNLLNIWENLNNSQVRKNWFPFGMLSGLWKDSVYNSQPLIDLVHANLDLNKIRTNGRKIAVGAVSMETGRYKSFTQDDDSFVNGVLASSSYPMGLNPIVINGEKFTDGGLKHILPIQEAIDFGATEIDIITCAPSESTAKFDDENVITFAARSFDLITDQIVASDLKIADLYNQLVKAGARPDKKHIEIKIYRPTSNLDFGALDFNNKSINQMIDIGYADAQKQNK